MACPFLSSSDSSQNGENKTKKGGTIYAEYLKLDNILVNHQLTHTKVGKTVHDEHLFIVTHQANELWFKQIIVELDSIRELFKTKFVDESQTLIIVNRLNRIVMILKLLADQFPILETMTPLDFHDFRGYLAPASGFQSVQFRVLENKLGIKQEQRVIYNKQHYKDPFSVPQEAKDIDDSADEPSLLELVQNWLSRTPGLECDKFNFWTKYQNAVKYWLEDTILKPAKDEKTGESDEKLLAEYAKQKESFESIFDEEIYQSYVTSGERRFMHKAFKGALLISLYRDEPRFHQPFQVMHLLMDIDSLLTKWRYNHVMMVQRMLGNKMGLGNKNSPGGSGYQYLRSTMSDRYKVFLDLFNLSTYLIPRMYIPPLTLNMERRLCTMEKFQESNIEKEQ